MSPNMILTIMMAHAAARTGEHDPIDCTCRGTCCSLDSGFWGGGGCAHPLFAAIAANRPVRQPQKAAITIKLR